MKRIAALVAITLALVVYGAIAAAQQPKKVPRIGYLSALDPAREAPRSEGIRLALRELGHIEGQNIATEYRYTEANPNRAPELAAELVRLKIGLTIPPEVLAQASRLIR
jgi:putative tryptophan/tyrosine transport system substrate-binding protein